MESSSTIAPAANGTASRWREDAATWLKSRRLELWIVFGIWAIATAVIYSLSVGHVSPRRYQDEFLFWEIAQSFASGEGLNWRGVDLNLRSWLYPVLLAPAFWFTDSIPSAYTGVHLINSMMMVGTVFPAFLLARLFLGQWQATLAAVIAISVPAMNYAGIIGTENLAYLTCTAAFGGMLLALARPRRRNWALAIATLLVAMLTRTQFVILLPILLASLLLVAAMRASGERKAYLREQRGLLIGLGSLFVLGGLWFLIQGRGAVGLYGGVFDGLPITFDAMAFWTKAFAADIYLLAAIIPVIATLAMFGHAENRRDPLVGALLALTLVASVVFLLQVAGFSATNPYDWRGRNIFYERYMFYLGPLFFTGLLVAWRRVSVGSAVISVAVATLVVSGFQTDAVLVPFSYDSFGLSLIGRHMKLNPESVNSIGMLMARVTLALGVVYVVSTVGKISVARVFHWLGVAITIGLLLATQAQTWHYARLYSGQAFDGVPKPANFIDKNTEEDVGLIVTSTDSPEMYFTTEFWNDRVKRMFVTEEEPIASPIMYSPTCQFDWNAQGEILGTGCDLVPSAWFLRSDDVTMHFKNEVKRVHPSAEAPSLTLMVAEPPPRLLSIASGRDVRNGVVQGAMSVKTFLGRPGKIRVKLAPSASAHFVQIADEGPVRVGPNGALRVTAPLAADETDTRISFKSVSGLPDNVAVEQIEVREPGGPWISVL